MKSYFDGYKPDRYLDLKYKMYAPIDLKRCGIPSLSGHPKRGYQENKLVDHLFETLRSLLVHRKEEALSSGVGEIVEVIFHLDGKQMEQNFIRRIFKRVLSKAGLREIRFHDIRHTYPSLLLTEAASPVYVKEQLGHSSIQVTVDIYGHLIPSSNRAFVNRLDLRPSAPQVRPPEKEKAQPLEIAPLPETWCRRGD